MNNESPQLSEIEAKIISNNAKISELLAENENLLRQAGFDPPAINFAPKTKERIHLPTGYIRRKKYYVEKYKLNEFFHNNKVVVSNVAYSLQMSDLYNFLMCRFYVFGSLETMIYKAAIINFVCIIESLIGQVFDDMHSYCLTCSEQHHCKYYLSKTKTFSEKIIAIEKRNLLRLTHEQYKLVREAYHLRNHMHIYSVANVENEAASKTFNLNLHNNIVRITQQITATLYNDMFPATKNCYKKINCKDD